MSGMVKQERRGDTECKSSTPLADYIAICSLKGQNMEDHPSATNNVFAHQEQASRENERFKY